MVKSFQTSGGTVLSTNWDEVRGGRDTEQTQPLHNCLNANGAPYDTFAVTSASMISMQQKCSRKSGDTSIHSAGADDE